MMDAIVNKGYKRVIAVLPRRAGKDIAALNLAIRELVTRPQTIYYIFPTYQQAKKVIWNGINNDGMHFLDYIPNELVDSKNGQEMIVRFKNGSILALVGSDNYNCFDDKTEILTNCGWLLFKDLMPHHKVGTMTGSNLTFQEPEAIIEADYNGEMYKINNSSIDMLVTPNHRFYVRSNKGFYKFKKISDKTIVHDSIPSQSGWIGLEKPFMRFPNCKRPNPLATEDFVALLGIFLAEGSTFSNEKCYRVTISQTKQHIRDKIEDLLNRIDYNYVTTKDGFNIENKAMYEYFAQFGTQENRFIPSDIKELSQKYLKILFDWMVMGDGHVCPTYTGYYSISKKLIDDVQEVIIKLGLSGNISTRVQKPVLIKERLILPKKTLYEIRIRKSKFKRFQSSKKNYITYEPYKGKVYCVTTRSGIIKVRRNGKECWSGNSLMGTNPSGIIFSEYALQDERAYPFLRPILTANGGWALFISTPRGKNHLYTLYEIAKNSDDWFCYKMGVDETQHIPMKEIDKEREDGIMSEDLIQQEYYCSFDMGVEGGFYTKYFDKMRLKGQITQVPWEPAFKVNTSWDIGVRDSTAIIFFQCIGTTVRIIDCYEKNKEGLEHYVNVLESKPYSYGKHIAPHDIRVREFGSGITRIEKARQLGIKFTIAEDIGIFDGIEAVRSTLSKVWIDEVKCKDLIKALENYRQEYDSKRAIYKTQPLHNYASHYADSMRYLAVSLPKTRDGTSPEELDRRYEEAVFGINKSLPSVFRNENDNY